MIELKENTAESQTRVEAWWNNERTDRACIQVTGYREEPLFELPVPQARNLHAHWTDPDIAIPRALNIVGATWYGGEAFPVVYPVPGRIVSITSKFLGAPNIYVDENTTWSEPIIDSWADAPPLTIDPDNEWWRLTLRNMEICADEIRRLGIDAYLGMPDLNGPTEVLAGLRSPEKLCMDLIMEPKAVKSAARKVQDAWFQAWRETSAVAHQFGGYFNFMRLWSSEEATDLQSDFSSLISPDMFAEFVLPLIKEQVDAFPRTCFHLDGPDMVRHLDFLVEIDGLNAIQWVQGAGAGPVTGWMDVMHRIQDGGKALYVYCTPEDVPTLLGELDHKGLMMVVSETLPLDEARDLVRMVEASAVGSKSFDKQP